MSDLISIGASGVRAYQSALGVVGDNIANVGTKGYVRRDVVLKEVAAGHTGFATQVDRFIQGGVSATGVTRAWDQFRAAEVRRGSAEAAGSQTAIPWLERIETSLDKGGLAGGLTRFFNAAAALAADPAGSGPRSVMLEAAGGVADAFRATANGLAATVGDIADTASATASELSRLAAGLAETNAGILRARPGSSGQAQLLDQRDRLLDQMATLAKIDVAVADDGTAAVRMEQANGPVLVDRSGAGSVTASIGPGGSIDYNLHHSGTRQAIGISSGALAGLREAAQRAVGARTEIDRLATAFAAEVNAVQAAGVDLDGRPGAPLFAVTDGAATIARATGDPRAIAAARPFTVSAGPANTGEATLTVAADPDAAKPAAMPMRLERIGGDLVATDPATGTELGRAAIVAGAAISVAGLSVTLTGIPAEGNRFTLGATGAGSRDAGNLQALADMRRTAGHEKAHGTLVTANAAHLAQRRLVAEAQVAIRDGAVNAREAVSGVNLDNEAVELLRFQQAYSASSRIIQVARETFQSILDASR